MPFIGWLAAIGVVGQGKESWPASADRRGFASRILNPSPRPTTSVAEPLHHHQALAAERADTPVKPLTRREQHHGNVAFRSLLVLVIVGPLRCHDWPHAL